MEAVTIKNLNFLYLNNSNFALKHINLTVEEGEFITLFGASGCGKTTLIKHLKPEYTPQGEKSGEILFFGKDINSISTSQDVGFVKQDVENQIVCDKVWHEIVFGLECLGISNDEMHKRVAEISAFLGIDWLYEDVNSLSGGQKQLMNLASVMVTRPRLLILDEPTAQLDPVSAENFLHILKKINSELGTTIILSEHRLEEVIPISDKIICMESGEIVAYDTPKIVCRQLKKEKHIMFHALPTPMRAYLSVSDDFECPLDVKEGRKWLVSLAIKNIAHIKKNENCKRENNPVVELKNVCFRYEKETPDILKGVNLTVNKGEIYAITGGNGSAKSTLLKVVNGINKPYYGKVKTEGKITALPQNPQFVFTQKTVIDEFKAICNDNALIEKYVNEFDIFTLLSRNPFDLSGGEIQRVGIVKAILTNPDILLLDEPTKGLDFILKEKLGKVLKELKSNGMTVIIVSHDIEFCALTANVCALLFDGEIAAEGEPESFFSNNSFYTTAAARMSKGIMDGVVTANDVISLIGGTENKLIPKQRNDVVLTLKSEPIPKEKTERKKIKPFKVVLILLFALCIALQWVMPREKTIYLEIAMGVIVTAFFFKLKQDKKVTIEQIYRNKIGIIPILTAVILIPATVLFGMYFLDDRKYYFTSILVLFEIFSMFIFRFENRKASAREIVLLAALTALSVGGRLAFYMLSNFKPALAIIIITGAALGAESGFLVGALTAFISNMFFGQGPWTPWQMFAMGISGFMSGILFKSDILPKKRIVLSFYGLLTALFIYGGIVNISSALVWEQQPTLKVIISYLILGFKFDLIHGIATAFFMFVLSGPVIYSIERIKHKYGLEK